MSCHIKNYDILIITIVTVLVGTVAIAADMASRSMFLVDDVTMSATVVVLVP